MRSNMHIQPNLVRFRKRYYIYKYTNTIVQSIVQRYSAGLSNTNIHYNCVVQKYSAGRSHHFAVICMLSKIQKRYCKYKYKYNCTVQRYSAGLSHHFAVICMLSKIQKKSVTNTNIHIQLYSAKVFCGVLTSLCCYPHVK